MQALPNAEGNTPSESNAQDAAASAGGRTIDATGDADASAARQPHPVRLAKLRGFFRHLWDDEHGELDKDNSNELAIARTDLAISRTLMAADRTLMAWVRTAMSMNSFGFTIYKLLDAYSRTSPSMMPGSDTPRNVGLFLTGMGTFAMVMGVVEYWQSLKDLRGLKKLPRFRPTLIMGLLMALVGLLLFFSIITKLF